MCYCCDCEISVSHIDAQVVLIAEYGECFRRSIPLVCRCSDGQISYGYSVLSGFQTREVLCCCSIRPRIRVVGRAAPHAQVKRAVGYVGGAGVQKVLSTILWSVASGVYSGCWYTVLISVETAGGILPTA